MVEVVGNKMAFSVQGPMVGELQEPSFKYALPRVKVCRGSKDVEKNNLDNFLGLARISHDSQSYAVNEMVIPIK